MANPFQELIDKERAEAERRRRLVAEHAERERARQAREERRQREKLGFDEVVRIVLQQFRDAQRVFTGDKIGTESWGWFLEHDFDDTNGEGKPITRRSHAVQVELQLDADELPTAFIVTTKAPVDETYWRSTCGLTREALIATLLDRARHDYQPPQE